MGWFDLNPLGPEGHDDFSPAVVVDAGAGDDLLTVARSDDDRVVTGGSTSSTPWSISVDEPDPIVINTVDAGAVVKTIGPWWCYPGPLTVNRGSLATYPVGSGWEGEEWDADAPPLAFFVTGFGTSAMSLFSFGCNWWGGPESFPFSS